MVAIHHTCLDWGGVLFPVGNVAWLGVACFYIPFGLVLVWSWSPDRSTGEFFVRRIARIYPVHVITFALSLKGFRFVGGPLGGYVGNVPGMIAELFVVHDWLQGHPSVRRALNGVSWSLSVEFAFDLCMLTTCIGVGDGILHAGQRGRLHRFYQLVGLPLGRLTLSRVHLAPTRVPMSQPSGTP